jgi:hypothetical protein
MRGIVLPLVVSLSAAAAGIVFHEIMERAGSSRLLNAAASTTE